MKFFFNISAGIIVLCLAFFLYFYLSYDLQKDKLKAFESDGCSMFFDGTWGECCFEHDKIYHKGGASYLRYRADLDLKKCVREKSSSLLLSEIIYIAVRIFGSPYLPSPWRWGFGYSYGRAYR